MVNAMTNLVVQAVRKMGLPSCLPSRELSSWSDYAAPRRSVGGFLGAKTKAVILGVAHRGVLPDVEHAESARWLGALSTESASDFGLLHDLFIEGNKPGPEISTFANWWQTV